MRITVWGYQDFPWVNYPGGVPFRKIGTVDPLSENRFADVVQMFLDATLIGVGSNYGICHSTFEAMYQAINDDAGTIVNITDSYGSATPVSSLDADFTVGSKILSANWFKEGAYNEEEFGTGPLRYGLRNSNYSSDGIVAPLSATPLQTLLALAPSHKIYTIALFLGDDDGINWTKTLSYEPPPRQIVDPNFGGWRYQSQYYGQALAYLSNALRPNDVLGFYFEWNFNGGDFDDGTGTIWPAGTGYNIGLAAGKGVDDVTFVVKGVTDFTNDINYHESSNRYHWSDVLRGILDANLAPTTPPAPPAKGGSAPTRGTGLGDPRGRQVYFPKG
jgi:hypothetical protein